MSDDCREEVFKFKITRNSNINYNIPLGALGRGQAQRHVKGSRVSVARQVLEPGLGHAGLNHAWSIHGHSSLLHLPIVMLTLTLAPSFPALFWPFTRSQGVQG